MVNTCNDDENMIRVVSSICSCKCIPTPRFGRLRFAACAGNHRGPWSLPCLDLAEVCRSSGVCVSCLPCCQAPGHLDTMLMLSNKADPPNTWTHGRLGQRAEQDALELRILHGACNSVQVCRGPSITPMPLRPHVLLAACLHHLDTWT